MTRSFLAAILAVSSLAVSNRAQADSGAAAALQGFAKTLGAPCNGDTCAQLDLTLTELFSGHRARYCQAVVQPHTWDNKGASMAISEIVGSSPQYRADQTWTYGNAIDFLKSLGYSVGNPVPPRINLTQPFPFSPFQTDTCLIRLNSGNGSLTVGSAQPGKGEADISYDLGFKADTFYGIAPSGGGAVVIATPGTYTVQRPPR